MNIRLRDEGTGATTLRGALWFCGVDPLIRAGPPVRLFHIRQLPRKPTRASAAGRGGPPHKELLLVLPAYSPQGPSFPETALNGIDTIFFPHIPVCGPVRPFTPEALLDLL